MGLKSYRNAMTDGARAELAQRIAALGLNTNTKRSADLAEDLAAIRRIAQAAGMQPAVSVARVLDAALARGERGPLVQCWIEVLRDAVCCERSDSAACDAYVAACSVRLAS